MQFHLSRSVRRKAVGGLIAACAVIAAGPGAAHAVEPGDLTPDSVAVAPAGASSLAAATGLPIPESAVPQAPGPPWSFSAGVSTQGITFRATSGYARLAGLIRWNRAYTFSASITDSPFKGGRLSVGGSLSGRDIFRPIPLSGLRGYLSGPIEIASNVALIGGNVDWTAKGLEFRGGLRFQCSNGSLDASASALFVNENDFKVSAVGQASACTLGRAVRIDGRTFWAGISSTGGKLALDAGFRVSRLDLFTLPIGSSRTSTYLENIGGSIAIGGANSLAVTFRGTGGADLRARGLPPLRLRGTLAGAFALRGAQISQFSLALSGVKVNGLTVLPTIGLGRRLVADTTAAFTTS